MYCYHKTVFNEGIRFPWLAPCAAKPQYRRCKSEVCDWRGQDVLLS